jgi:hypothetical protein
MNYCIAPGFSVLPISKRLTVTHITSISAASRVCFILFFLPKICSSKLATELLGPNQETECAEKCMTFVSIWNRHWVRGGGREGGWDGTRWPHFR